MFTTVTIPPRPTTKPTFPRATVHRVQPGAWATDDGYRIVKHVRTYELSPDCSAKGRPHGVDPKHRSRRMAGLRAVDGPGLGLPRKSLIGIPWRVALALQDDGWTLRSNIIWRRTTALGEPTAKDRPWRQYEHVFLFSKGPRYRDAGQCSGLQAGGEGPRWEGR